MENIERNSYEVKLHFINENINIEELGIDSEEAFQKYLKSCIISNCLNIKIQVSTQQRPFTEWNLKSLKLAKLVIAGNNEATKDKFVLPFLVIAASTFRGRIKIYPQYDVSGTYGCGPLDFCIHLDEDIICVVEVKKSDIDQGVAQCMMQLHAFFELRKLAWKEEGANKQKKISLGCLLMMNHIKIVSLCGKASGGLSLGERTTLSKLEQRVDYDFLLKLQSLIIDWCIDGVILRNVYNQALDHLKSERPDLSDKFVRSLGHGIGTEFHESAYVLNSNSNKVFKNGMVLNLIVGFQNITNPKAKDDQTKNYSIWIIDTVKISDDTCHYMTDGNRNRDATTFFTEDKEDDENKKYTTTLFKDEERKEHQAELARQKQTDGLACLLEGKRDNMIEVHEQIVKLKKNSTKKEAEHILADVFNIKHLFFQPCDYELIVILHIHLINPIIFGKEKAKYVDEEEVGSELKEHRRQFLLNKSFKGFANKIAGPNNEKVHVGVPFRDIGFFGFPFKTNVLLQPTTDCLVRTIKSTLNNSFHFPIVP
ncbi:10212_t:CDS:2 [Entrophospora sp. SA101]|nr:10212_t:CDS:2 [Entrophospora sp. SA101]